MSKDYVLEFDNNSLLPLLFGEHNIHLQHLENKLGVSISDRGNTLTLYGNPSEVKVAMDVLKSLWKKLEDGQEIGVDEIDAALRFWETTDDKPKNGSSKPSNGREKNVGDIIIKTKNKSIAPRSPNQATYIKMIQDNPMVFGLGPAGTGKTYLAVAVGVSMYLQGLVKRLIFCRPAVEAGEHLGFLPGDMKEKVDPYVRPIYDALFDMMPWDEMMKKMEAGDIEVAPLAFMRGRTLSNAFVILDEAQNTTSVQMKMFLTRMGQSSRMVITGDMSQTDLPSSQKSGLLDAKEILSDVEEIKFMEFDRDDVVRNPLVSKIIKAYDAKK